MTESVTPSEEPTRKRRRWGLIVVALCLLLGFAALGAATVWSWGNRAQVLEWAIATYLKGDKVEHVSLSVERADIDRLAIRDLRIEGETSVFVKSINADYVIDDLLIGSIDRFVAQKVRVVTGETAIEIDEIKGAATFSGDLGNLQELSAGLDFIRLRIAGQEFEPSRIEVDYRDDVLSVDGALSGPNGFVTMVAGGPINSETESFDVFLAGRFDAAATAAWIGPDAVDMSGYISSTVAAKFKNPAFFLEERSSDDPMLPEDLTVDGRINLALDRLVVGGVEIPTAQKDRIDFKLADLTFQEEVSAGRFAIALQVDKRSTPQLEFEKGTLQLAGAYAVDPDRLVVRFAEGPLVQLHDARIAQEVPVGGVMKLELLGDTNRLDVERTRERVLEMSSEAEVRRELEALAERVRRAHFSHVAGPAGGVPPVDVEVELSLWSNSKLDTRNPKPET